MEHSRAERSVEEEPDDPEPGVGGPGGGGGGGGPPMPGGGGGGGGGGGPPTIGGGGGGGGGGGARGAAAGACVLLPVEESSAFAAAMPVGRGDAWPRFCRLASAFLSSSSLFLRSSSCDSRACALLSLARCRSCFWSSWSLFSVRARAALSASFSDAGTLSVSLAVLPFAGAAFWKKGCIRRSATVGSPFLQASVEMSASSTDLSSGGQGVGKLSQVGLWQGLPNVIS